MDLSNIKIKITSLLGNIQLKYIAIVVALIIIGEAIWAYRTIITTGQPIPVQTGSSVTQSATSNIISLTAPKAQFKIGEVIPVSINIDSNKSTVGVDLIIHYDSNLLSLAPNTLKTPVSLSNIYDEYPINQVDEKNGTIAVSGITNKIEGIIPKGLFGTILFQAKAAGNAKVFLQFTKGATNDTNIIQTKTSSDVLEGANNISIQVIP